MDGWCIVKAHYRNSGMINSHRISLVYQSIEVYGYSHAQRRLASSDSAILFIQMADQKSHTGYHAKKKVHTGYQSSLLTPTELVFIWMTWPHLMWNTLPEPPCQKQNDPCRRFPCSIETKHK